MGEGAESEWVHPRQAYCQAMDQDQCDQWYDNCQWYPDKKSCRLQPNSECQIQTTQEACEGLEQPCTWSPGKYWNSCYGGNGFWGFLYDTNLWYAVAGIGGTVLIGFLWYLFMRVIIPACCARRGDGCYLFGRRLCAWGQ